MRVLLIGRDTLVGGFAKVIENELGPDGQRYVTDTRWTLPAHGEERTSAAYNEIAIVHWTWDDDETLLDPLLETTPVVILLAAHPNVPFCVRALRRGAWDYLEMAPEAGDPIDAVLASMRNAVDMLGVGRGAADVEWIRSRFDELHAAHAGQWIAVRGETLIAGEPLFARLYRRDDTKGAVFWKMPERRR